MSHWMFYAAFAIVLWGVNGLFMKLGTNRISARAMVIWVTAGFLVLLPFLWATTTISGLGVAVIAVGLIAGAVNGLGNWAIFASLERGAKASVAIPLTALYPLCTVVLATALLGERPNSRQWIGIGMALAAGAMLSYEPAPISAPKEHLRCSE